MLEKTRKLLAPPVFEDPETNFVARNLFVILMAALTGTIFTLFQYFLFGETRPILLGGGIAIIVSIYFLHRGWVKMASYLGLLALSAIPFLLLIHSGGIHDTVIMLLPVLIVAASMLLSWRGLVIYVVTISILVAAVVHAEINGLLATAYNNLPTTFSDAVDVLTILTIAALMSGLLAISLRRNLRSLEKTLKERKASEERYVTLFSAAPMMYVTSRNESGTPIITNCNESFLRTLGYPPELVIGCPLGNFYTPQGRIELSENGGFQRALQGEAKTPIERDLVAQDGHIVHTLLQVVPDLDETGRAVGILAMYLDITERKQVEEALAKSEAMLRRVQEVARMGSWQIDLSTNTVVASSEAHRIYGIPKGLLTLADIQSVPLPEFRAALDAALNALITRGKRYDVEFKIQRQSDNQILDIHSIAEYDSVNKTIVGSIQDITERKQAEEALQKSEALYRQAIEVANAVPYHQAFCGKSLEYDFIGEGIRQITGYGPEEFTESLWDSITSERVLLDELAGYSFGEAIEKVRSGVHPVWKCNHRIRARDGSIHWVFEAAVEQRDDDGISRGSIGMFQDITERKQAEEKLRLHAEQMASLYEIGLAITSNLDLDHILERLFEECKQLLPIDTFYIAIYDGETYLLKHPLYYDGGTQTRIQVEDRDIQTTPGLSGHVILGRKTLYLPDLTDPATQEKYQSVTTGSIPLRSYAGVPMFSHERVVGVISMQKFETNAYSSEQIQFLETIATQAAAAIENARLYRELESRLKTLDLLHQVSQEITASLDLERVLTTTTLAVKDLLGGFSSSIFTIDGDDLVFDVTSGEMEADIKSFRFPLDQGITGWIVANKQPVIINDIPNDPRYLDTLDKKAGIIVQNMLAVPLLVNDRCIGVLNVINKPGGFSEADLKLLDMFAVNVGFAIENARLYASAQQELAERKKTQAELEASNRELESLSYNIAHDMRSPVRAMVGYSTILQQSQGHKLDADGQVELGNINAAAKRLGVLIDGFLEYLRLGRRAICKQPVQVEKLVNSISAHLLARNPARQIQVSIASLPDCQADPVLLEQVWMHLLMNAVKFTRPRATALIEIGAGEKDGETYYFIRDNGIGFDMQYAAKIFILFQHLNSQEEYEGNGIGLAIVQRIIQHHGGRIWVETEPDKGACFYFVL